MTRIINHSAAAPGWMNLWLTAAGAYNLVWGLTTIAFPRTTLGWMGLSFNPTTGAFWQCIGMIVGVYGIGYLIAAKNPYRHWPIILIGLLGKIFGPIGFLQAAAEGILPWRMGWTILTNDLLWWIPFAIILWKAIDHHQGGNRSDEPVSSLRQAMQQVRDQQGQSLLELTHSQPRLVVLLRHAGCTFCRQTLDDLRRQRAAIEARGLGIILVHPGEDVDAAAVARRYQLGDIPRVADPRRLLYRALELPRGGFMALFGPRVFILGLGAAIFQGHGVGKSCGDGFQLGGAFILHQGRLVRAFRQRSAADRTAYEHLVCPIPTPPGPRAS